MNPGDAALPDSAAWAQAEIPLPPPALFDFLADVERLFRLNPYLDIQSWESAPQGGFRLRAANEANGCRYEVTARLEVLRQGAAFTLTYDRGLKRATEFAVEPAGAGSLLTVIDHYHPVDDPQDQRLREVDRSLVPWVAAIRRHVRGRARYGRLPAWRWWTERFLLGMPPRQRRIVRLIVWVSALEFLVFLLLVLAFWLERGL